MFILNFYYNIFDCKLIIKEKEILVLDENELLIKVK